ncbi:hypothetical protein [Zunongwangia sp. HGR-M22]|nr:hypothetical protein [Zunongwangia sp. HGR-M22]WBL24031.1 hypothetical protein PBT91_08790 [Zunongwangia sp. HGR-M22]
MKRKRAFQKSGHRNYYFKERFQQLLVAIFVKRRLSSMISPFRLSH